jgi:hypothetical protein
MQIVSNRHEWVRLARVVGIVLLIAAPGLALGTWHSTRQPLEVMALAERMKTSLPPDQYSSAVYHGSGAQRTLDQMWSPTGFATLGVIGFAVAIGLLYFAFVTTRKSGQIVQ